MTPYGMTEREYVTRTIALEEQHGRAQSAQFYRDYLDTLDFMNEQDASPASAAREALRVHAGITVR